MTRRQERWPTLRSTGREGGGYVEEADKLREGGSLQRRLSASVSHRFCSVLHTTSIQAFTQYLN